MSDTTWLIIAQNDEIPTFVSLGRLNFMHEKGNE